MASWANLINMYLTESEEDEDVAECLFDAERGFKPNVGGQSRLFNYYPLGYKPPTFENSPRWLLACGGIGSGKTFSGAIWLRLQSLWFPKQRGAIVANTFGQLQQSTLVTLVEACKLYNIPLEPMFESTEDTAIKISNMRRCYIGEERAFIRVLSINAFVGNSQSGRGQELHYAWFDEGLYAGEKGFQTLDGRLRSKGGQFCRGLLTSSPNGYNWGYSKFADPNRSEELQRLYHMVSMPTKENIEHVGADYVHSLQANYGGDLAAQELEGLFVDVTVGRIYKYFNRKLHTLSGVDAEVLAYDPKLPLRMAFDFNATPCVCVLNQMHGDDFYLFKEFYLYDADLFELMMLIIQWLDAHPAMDRNLYIYGDATGRRHTAESRLSSWDIVFQSLKKTNRILHRKFENSNPRVMNRIHAMNSAFMKNRIYADMDNCPEIVKDWEQLTYDKDSGIDKSDQLRSHLSDAFGYEVEREQPLILPLKARMEQRKPSGFAA